MHTKLDYLCKLTHVDYVLSGSVNPDYSDEFNVTKIKIINNLYDKKRKIFGPF
ncbi:permeases of the major facilitator superfamily [Yersinia enterocolitica]|nr:permeases of the major facilitator superfamily [Yersinia enterocolitica]